MSFVGDGRVFLVETVEIVAQGEGYEEAGDDDVAETEHGEFEGLGWEEVDVFFWDHDLD